jgi:hypothetical protein
MSGPANAFEPNCFTTLSIGIWSTSARLAAQQPGPRAALAARQWLRNEVCIALNDGCISPSERYQILCDAKVILTPPEYIVFKQNLDRISPPRPMVAKKHSANRLAQKSTTTDVVVKTEVLQQPADVIEPAAPTISNATKIPNEIKQPEHIASLSAEM